MSSWSPVNAYNPGAWGYYGASQNYPSWNAPSNAAGVTWVPIPNYNTWGTGLMANTQPQRVAPAIEISPPPTQVFEKLRPPAVQPTPVIKTPEPVLVEPPKAVEPPVVKDVLPSSQPGDKRTERRKKLLDAIDETMRKNPNIEDGVFKVIPEDQIDKIRGAKNWQDVAQVALDSDTGKKFSERFHRKPVWIQKMHRAGLRGIFPKDVVDKYFPVVAPKVVAKEVAEKATTKLATGLSDEWMKQATKEPAFDLAG